MRLQSANAETYRIRAEIRNRGRIGAQEETAAFVAAPVARCWKIDGRIITEESLRIGMQEIATFFGWNRCNELIMDLRKDPANAVQKPIDFLACTEKYSSQYKAEASLR